MGCYQASLAPVLGPAAGVSQGRIAQSAISSGISYGVKNQTGKYPIEHILKREKNKIVKKIDLIEKEVVEKSIYVKKNFFDDYSFSLGLVHKVIWGGETKSHGIQPSKFRDYTRVVFARPGSQNSIDQEKENTLGNHLGIN